MQPLEGQPAPLPAAPAPGKHLNAKTLSLLLALFLIFKLLEHFTVANFAARATDLTTDNILQAVNQQRVIRNLGSLTTNDKLTAAAAWKANDMIVRKYFAHVDPDGNYIWPKIVAEGYAPYVQLGENLAIEFYDTDSLVAAWMNSPTHRENILQPNFKDQGMGLSFGDSTQGQYHSAIANTFGALLLAKSAPAPKPTPTPAPTSAPAKPKPSPTPVVVALPAVTASSSTANPPGTELQPRENAISRATTSSGSGTPTTTNNAGAGMQPPAGPVAPNPDKLTPEQQNLQPYQITHDFTLAFGIVLLVFLIADAQKLARTKMVSLDKKMGNLALLLISLVVIAFMYWL